MLSRLAIGILIALPLSVGQVSKCGGGDDDTPPPVTPTPGASCMATGCSGEICASEPVASPCIWTCEYGCYQYATCETQPTGACGWTSSSKYDECIKSCANQP